MAKIFWWGPGGNRALGVNVKRNADNQYREIFQSVFMLRADSLYNGYRRFCVKTIFLEDEEYVICNGDGEN